MMNPTGYVTKELSKKIEVTFLKVVNRQKEKISLIKQRKQQRLPLTNQVRR